MNYAIKITGTKEGFRAVAHAKLLQRDFQQKLFKAKRITDQVKAGEEVILRIPAGKNQSTALRKIRETGALAELTEQRRGGPIVRRNLHTE